MLIIIKLLCSTVTLVSEHFTVSQGLFFMQMAVLRSSALPCLHIRKVSGRNKQAVGLVGNVLTSVICVCLSGTRQRQERWSRESDWAEAYSLSMGWNRSAAVLYRLRTCTYRLHCRTKKYTQWLTHQEVAHTPNPQWWGQVQLFHDGLFTSHYQVISENFISSQSTKMIYLYRVPW